MIINSRKLVSTSTSHASPLRTARMMQPEIEPVAVRLRLIGQMEAWTLAAENILPTGRKTRALLAVLALSAPRPVLRGRLAEMLWSRRPEEQARASLRQEIHRLLDALGPVGNQILAITRDHLMLKPGMVWVDVEEVLRASPSKPAALVLLDGDLLEDLDGVDPAFDNWLAAERERLRDRARVLAEQMLRDQSDSDLTIPAAQQLLSIDRAHEGAWRALMRAYTQRGERGMALQAYERCRSVLADLLDAQPSEETQRLAAEIRATTPPQRPQAPLPPALRGDLPRDLRVPLRQMAPETRPEARSEMKAEPRPETRIGTSRVGTRVGVMPLQLVGVGEDEAHLASGLAEEITTALARFRGMLVVSSSALTRFAAQSRDETAIRRTFGTDYLLDGTIQRAPNRLRVSLRLLDLRAGNQIVWSTRFDRDSSDLLALQDDIAAEVAAQLDPEILQIEAARASRSPQAEADAYDLMLRALPAIGRLEKPQFLQAGEWLREAIALEPDNAPAHSWRAFWKLTLAAQGWAREPMATLAEARRLSDRAVMLDPQDAKALTIAGHVRLCSGGRLREAVALHDRALSLNPNLAMAWSLSGLAHAYLGDLARAEQLLAQSRKLAPMDPHARFLDTGQVLVALLKHDHAAAVAAGRMVSEMNPACAASCQPYLAALGHLGLHEEADIVRQRLLGILPHFTLRAFAARSPFERKQDLEHVLCGLRLAVIEP